MHNNFSAQRPCTKWLYVTFLELRHENIVKLIDVSLEEEQLFLIFEYLSMDLKHFLDSKKREKTKLTPDMVKSYTYQILQVIQSISIHFPSWYSGNVLLSFSACAPSWSQTAKLTPRSRKKYNQIGRFRIREGFQCSSKSLHTWSCHFMVSCTGSTFRMSGESLNRRVIGK